MISFSNRVNLSRVRADAVWRLCARASVYALAFLWPLCGLLFLARNESDPSQDDSRECKVLLLLLAQALGGEQRLHTATTTWRIGDHAASGTRTRHMHTAAVEAAGTRRAYFLALQDRSRAHMNTPSCTNTDSNSRLLGRTRRNRADQLIALIRGRTAAVTACTASQPSPRPSGDQEPSEAVTRTDTRPTHHQVAPRNRKLLNSLHIHSLHHFALPS